MRMDRWRITGAAVLGALIMTILFATSASADKAWSYDLAGELMSPYCPGRTVESCPSPQASELVQWMLVQEAGGATKEQVVAMLIERFGEEILGAPPAKGNALWLYVLPWLTFIGGGVIVAVALRRLVIKREVPAVASNPVEASQGGVIDQDLEKLVDADLAARG